MSQTRTLVIATRQSPLALWQAEHVRDALQAAHAGLRVDLLKLTTEGDRRLSASLARVGGKGLFIKELERALLAGEADLAVHSMKDVPAQMPDGFDLAGVLKRADPRDAFVCNQYAALSALPHGAHVGTASLRRQAQLALLRPDVRVGLVRGNVGTRLAKLDAGEFDALLLAHAGLERLGLQSRIAESFGPDAMLPAIGQGAIGIETRADDANVQALLAPILDADTDCCLRAERAVSLGLGGDCTLPLAGHATLAGDTLTLHAFLGLPDGSRHLRWSGSGPASEPEALGGQAVDALRAQGAQALLATLRQ